jgi:hypothetical protein
VIASEENSSIQIGQETTYSSLNNLVKYAFMGHTSRFNHFCARSSLSKSVAVPERMRFFPRAVVQRLDFERVISINLGVY